MTHHHHSHDHGTHGHNGHHNSPTQHASVRAEFSIIALSGMQRVGWVLPVVITLWLLAFWTMQSAA